MERTPDIVKGSEEYSRVRPLILLDPHPRSIDQIFDSRTKARLDKLGNVVWHDGLPLSDAQIDRYLPEVDILIGQSALSQERLDRAPRLKAVFNVESNFLPNIDYEECHRRGIQFLSTGPVFARPVAEMALGMALSSLRRIHEADAAIRAGRESLYGEGDNQDSFLLSGKTVSIVGFGNLGRSLLPLVQAFGGKVLVCDPWVTQEALRKAGVTPASLDECFRNSSVVFLLAAVTTENAGRIGKSEFDMMPQDAIVVLVSRAGIVDFDALLDAAGSGRIRAAIDVWPEEPIPRDHRARSTPNTLLQAHRAGNIPEVWFRMGEMVVDDLERILQGSPPVRCQMAPWATVAKIRSKPIS